MSMHREYRHLGRTLGLVAFASFALVLLSKCDMTGDQDAIGMSSAPAEAIDDRNSPVPIDELAPASEGNAGTAVAKHVVNAEVSG